MAKNEITSNPVLQNLSRTERNRLTEVVDSGRSEIQAARSGASTNAASPGRSLASQTNSPVESVAERQVTRRPMAASAEDDGAYNAFGSPSRSSPPARRSAYSPDRASRTEDAISDIGRQADDAAPIAAKAADDISPPPTSSGSAKLADDASPAPGAIAETPKPPAKLSAEQEALAKKAGVDPRLNDLLANPKDYVEGREAFFKAMGAEPGSAKRTQLNNGGEYNRFLAKQKEFDSLNVAAAEKAA
ncbi:MAG: hypothetical protein EOP11_25885, partial [Proteobacteria bacterium]